MNGSNLFPDDRILDALGVVAIAAGDIEIRYRNGVEATCKGDGSPVTLADQEANACILREAGALLPHIPIVSEEQSESHALPAEARAFLLVDPLDGTREYIAGSDEFTVNIGWIVDGVPVAGVLYAPVRRRLWIGRGNRAEVLDLGPDGLIAGATRRRIHARAAPEGGLVVLASLRHCNAETEAFLAALPPFTRRAVGSSLKFCMIAEGQADLYPRLSPTMQWDTAAGDAILRAAGGMVTTLDGAPLVYGPRSGSFMSPSFLALGDPACRACQF